MAISRSVFLKMRNISNRSCREDQNKYFMFNNFFQENCVVLETMWKTIVQLDRPQMAVWYGTSALYPG